MSAKDILIAAKAAVVFPLFLVYSIPAFRKQSFREDCQMWGRWKGKNPSRWRVCNWFAGDRAFRNLLYRRIGVAQVLLDWLIPGYDSLQLATPSAAIGGGLLIQHGFATIVNAERIGRNFKVYQQVTIGYDHTDKAPVIGDNVEVCCGAKVIGNIKVGNNVIIGANAVVVKDVPDNVVVAGVPARIIAHLDGGDIIDHYNYISHRRKD